MNELTNDNQIVMYIHCKLCLDEWRRLDENISPQQWSQLEVGFTRLGVQVWCKRHDCNVLNLDFEGHQHPADTTQRT